MYMSQHSHFSFMAPAVLRRVALYLCLAAVLCASPVIGQTAPVTPAPVARSTTAPAPHRGFRDRVVYPLLRIFGHPPRIQRQAVPRSMAAPINFERFSANIALFRAVNTHRAPWLDGLCLVVIYLGSGWMLVPAVAYAVILRRQLLPVLLTAAAIESVLVYLLKQLCQQPRPGGMLADVFVAEDLFRRSFPSGDAAMAFMLAWALKRGLPWPARGGLILYAMLVAYERMYLGVHFPLDVTAGALIGILSVLLAERLFARKSAKMKAVEAPAEAG